MRVAFVLRGGVSRLSGQERRLSGSFSDQSSEYVDIKVCQRAYFQNVFEANPGCQFDVYLQSWNPDLKIALEELYRPVRSSFEPNEIFGNEIHKLSFLSLRNRLFKEPGRLLKHLLRDGFSYYRETYAGISSLLAICKAIQLIPTESRASYDLVIIARPDVVLLEPMRLQEYDSSFVYCNNTGGRLGDFRWCLNPQYLGYFADLLESVNSQSFHSQHYWIRDFFDKSLPGRYVEDAIVAGRDEEVLRKVPGNKELLLKFERNNLL